MNFGGSLFVNIKRAYVLKEWSDFFEKMRITVVYWQTKLRKNTPKIFSYMFRLENILNVFLKFLFFKTFTAYNS
jgi:hypothetical protein